MEAESGKKALGPWLQESWILALKLSKIAGPGILLNLGTGALCPFQELGGGSPGSGLPQPPTVPHGVPLGLARPRHPYNPAGGWDTPEALHGYHGYQLPQGGVKPFLQHPPAAPTGLCQNLLVWVNQGERASLGPVCGCLQIGCSLWAAWACDPP